MKERCRDGCRISLLIAGVVLVPAIFHTLLPPCHPYITIHFMEMIFSTCYKDKYFVATEATIIIITIDHDNLKFEGQICSSIIMPNGENLFKQNLEYVPAKTLSTLFSLVVQVPFCA